MVSFNTNDYQWNWNGTYNYTINKLNNTLTVSVNATLKNITSTTITAGSWVGCSLSNSSVDSEFNRINNYSAIIDSTLSSSVQPNQTVNISGSHTFTLKSDGTTGSSTGVVSVTGIVNDIFTIGEVKASNGHTKVNNTWKNCWVWYKISGVWKRCFIWKKISGTWKKGI